MTRLSKCIGGGITTVCQDCNGNGRREFCAPRGKGFCVELGLCRTCWGYGYLPIPQPPERPEAGTEQSKMDFLLQAGAQDL